MGKNRNRHKTKNNNPPKTNTSTTLGDLFMEQGVNINKLKKKLTGNEKKKTN
tara:strand:- start:301 stop:456 length:156 start_codon:yes stop_codon:yes gene_type:complete